MAPRKGMVRGRPAAVRVPPLGVAGSPSLSYPGTVMDGAGQGYAPPRVRDYGDLVALTSADASLLHVGIGGAAVNQTSSPIAPGGGGGMGGNTSPNSSFGDTLPATGGGDNGGTGGDG